MMDAMVKQLCNRDEISPKPRSPWSIVGRKKGLCKTIDGAKSHILEDDMEFKEAVDEIGLNLTVFTQSPNSPDTNILDLGFSEPYSRSTMIALQMRKN